MAGPRLLVDSPSGFTPLPYGLLSAADRADSDNPHWQNGITYTSSCVVTGGGFTTYEECIAVTGEGGQVPPPPAAKADNVNLTHRAATPFTVYAEFDCAPVGMDDARQLAERALAKVEAWQVEQAVWTGSAGGQNIVYPHLAEDTEEVLGEQVPVLLQSAAITVTGTGVKMSIALGLLEEQLGKCAGGVGVIHVPRHALPALAGAFGGKFEPDDGGRIRTQNGNSIAAGIGYTGSSPAGNARSSPNETWIYGTGPVFYYESAVRILGEGGQLDRAENTRKLIAEKTYLFGWDCCHFAVLVNLAA